LDNNYDDPYALEDALKAQKKLAQGQIEDFRRHLKSVMKTKSGRRVLWALYDLSDPLGLAFTGNAFTNYNLGRHELGKWLLNEMRTTDLKLWRLAEDENEQPKEKKCQNK